MHTLIWFKAIDEGDVERVKKNIADGFDVNTLEISSRNALHCIGKYKLTDEKKAYEIAKVLIENGIDLEQEDWDGITPLLESTLIQYFPKITELLIDKGANIQKENKWGNNVLTFAILSNNFSLAKKLMDLGMDINHVNFRGETIIEIISGRTNKYEKYRFFQKHKHLLCEKQREIIEKEKLRMLFKNIR